MAGQVYQQETRLSYHTDKAKLKARLFDLTATTLHQQGLPKLEKVTELLTGAIGVAHELEGANGPRFTQLKELNALVLGLKPSLNRHGSVDLMAVAQQTYGILTGLESELEADIYSGSMPDPLLRLEKIFSRFHRCLRRLQLRHSNRPTLTITDEYDVQDLLGSLLQLDFLDVREESAVPQYAGGNSRIDFLLPDERMGVEVKKTNPKLNDREVGAQLAIDIARYRADYQVKTLVCFVYDPDAIIGNPDGLVKDLERLSHPDIAVRVFIFPR